jgi:valyl-tRNA synthetase
MQNYNPGQAEPALEKFWQEQGIYHFERDSAAKVYSIDTPPPTVSGHLHLGHVYSYSHTDFMARFWRMRGYNVYYPMGYDDNGLPTERLVEKRLGITAQKVGREAFIQKCLEVSEEAEKDYQGLWQRLGLSVDWRYSYRSIDELSRRTSQHSFVDLYHKNLVYRRKAPAIWCPECRTAIAQAELNDLDRESQYVTLAFKLADGETLPIATTRPELLPACVAIFVHPDDPRFKKYLGQLAQVPLFGQQVPILEDPNAEMDKGTGAVMCCTFGDVTDVNWWYSHQLPLIEVMGRDGRLTGKAAGDFAGLKVTEARAKIVETLEQQGLVLNKQSTAQSVRVHERCDTPVEYIVVPQWFVKVLDFKPELLAAGDQIEWYPAYMKARYQEWVENLRWDWCISRQRYFGVTFPVWYCNQCNEITVADFDQLPLDPNEQQPRKPCACGSTSFTPEQDVMDTWATSSMSPQIVGKWLSDPELYRQVYPMELRPQAHEIIRTWAFYTIVKSHHHFGTVPWKKIALSGWGLAGEGGGKISKSRGGGPAAPMAIIEKYSADAVRYWTSSTGFGKDSIINEEKIQMGAKLVTKMWNVAKFSRRFLEGYKPAEKLPTFSTADRWMLSKMQQLIKRVTALFEDYDYSTAKSETEAFFWNLADNYLEMSKTRLYSDDSANREGALYTLHQVLLTLLKLFAPFFPHVTEQIYQELFAANPWQESLHRSTWPEANEALIDPQMEAAGEALVLIATAVRRYKSDHSLSLAAELKQLQVAPEEANLREVLAGAQLDIMSVTRASQVEVVANLSEDLESLKTEGKLELALALK